MSVAIKQFNDLNGQFATKENLEKVMTLCEKENRPALAQRLKIAIAKIHKDTPRRIKVVDKAKDVGKGLSAPRHEGLAKQALNNCGRLNPGYKYGKDGKLQRSKVSLKTLKDVATKATDFEAAYKAAMLLEMSANVVKVLRERYNKGLKLTPKQVFEAFYRDSGGKTPERTTKKSDTLATPKKKVVAKVKKKEIVKEEKNQFIINWPIEEITINNELYPQQPDRKAINDILQKKQVKDIAPLSVWQDKKTKKVFLIDGINRLEAFRIKMEENVPVVFLKTEPAPAPALFGAKSKKNAPKTHKSVPRTKKNGLKSPIIEPKTTVGDQSIGGSSRPLLSGKPLKASDIANMQFETLPLDEGWENLFQTAPKNMRIAVWAKPKNGKTASCCNFASYLTKFGPVLYNFADQGINLSTKNLIEMSGLDKKENAYISKTDNLETLISEIEATGAQHVFIDMINQYINNGVTPHSFKKEVLQRFPDVGFTLIMEVTKGGDFKGDQSWTHLVDQLVTIENYIMDTKGRYGTGEKISWEEGAQKYAPQRYAEIKGNEVTEVPAEIPILATNENEEEFNFKVY